MSFINLIKISCYSTLHSPVTSDRTWLEVMSRWTFACEYLLTKLINQLHLWCNNKKSFECAVPILLICYKAEYRDTTELYSEAFDSDNTTLVDCYPTYCTDTDLGDRPPTPTQQRQVLFKWKSQKKTDRALISIKLICPQYLQKIAGCKTYRR